MSGSIPQFDWMKVVKNLSVKAVGPISEFVAAWVQQIQISYKSTRYFVEA
jgi:hypothetical protein